MKIIQKFLARCLVLVMILAPISAPSLRAEESTSEEVRTEPAVVVVADFEKGLTDRSNNLGQGSGSWNLDSTDINNSYCDDDIVQIVGKENEANYALKLNYSVASDLPSQNGWWTKLNAFDGSKYDYLELDVKGDSKKGFTDRMKVQIKKYKPGSKTETIKSSYEVKVTDEWETLRIPLNRMTGVIDFADPAAWQNPAVARKNLDEFVVVFQDRHVSEKVGTVYIDNIKFVYTGEGGPTAIDYPPRTKEKTETRIEGLEFTKFLITRLGGFPKETVVKKHFPENPDLFLLEVAKDTWRFFDEIVDKDHALPLDTIQIGETQAVDEKTWVGDYTNVTNIGVYLMVLVSAYDLGFISREEVVARIRKTMDTLERMEYHASGFPFNYYDTTTLERTSYFVSLVDSGWLIAGLYVAKNAFPEELEEQATRLIDRGDFVFFYDPVERQMYHGFYEHLEVYSDYHYGVFYTEPRAASYIAIARGEVPREHWFEGMIRTFTSEYDWQNQPPQKRVRRTTLGHTYFGGYYVWKGMNFIPSWGGSAFEALMPGLVLKEKELAPAGLGLNNQMHALGQKRFVEEETDYPVWGMSPSAVPEGGYSEYGAKPFGSKGYKMGAVTPHASALTLEYQPEAAVANLRKLIELYDIYGEYGFYDAVNPETGLVIRRYLALDQAMLFISINNYLNKGAIRERFHSDPAMKRGEELLTAEKMFE